MTSDSTVSGKSEPEGFSEHWLSLREPVDHAARDTNITEALANWAAEKPAVSIIELGAGTGSNLRYLMPQLGHQQHWLLLDNDHNLLSELPRILQTWCEQQGATLNNHRDNLAIQHSQYSATIKTRTIDLAQQLDDIEFAGSHLVTASALLDLTAKPWLDTLAERIVSHQCSCLFALNYNGQVEWQPELDADTQITQLLNAHQLSNKGFGDALGPAAGNYFADVLRALGRDVHTAISNWNISPQSYSQSAPLQYAVIDGWAEAATEQSSGDDVVGQWHAARKQAIEQQASTLRVSHVDVLSLV